MTVTTNWTAKEVADRLEEAFRTLKRLPKEKLNGYHTLWPTILYSPNELMFQEKLPLRLGPPPADAISRLWEVCDWIAWVEVSERKLLWQRAARIRWKVVCQYHGCDRTTVWRKWTNTLKKIAKKLDESHTIKR